MIPTSELSLDGSRLTVRLPMTIRKRGGRKVVVAPSGASVHPPRPRVDSSLIKAIARAYRWQRLLEEGTHASMRDLATAERISPSYVSRMLRLTLLSPDNVEAVLNGKFGTKLANDLVSQPVPVEWQVQRM